MTKPSKPVDPQSAFCEVCLKRIAISEALTRQMGDNTVAYFCSNACYDRWHGEAAPRLPGDTQEGLGRSISRDERMKRAIKRDSQREEPRTDSVEPDDLPPP